MKIVYKKKKLIGFVLLIVIISITLFTIGCGPSYDERLAKKKEERKELIRKKKEKLVIGQLVNKHNVVNFPPKNLGTASFTYEIQEFFNTHSRKSFVFKGYLEDIEQTEKGNIIEFLCPLGEDYFIYKKGIRFRLSISDDSIKQFLKGKREEDPFSRYIFDPDYYVLATIENIESSRIYSFDGTAHGEEVEDVSKSIIANGHFINAVRIPKN